MENINNLQQNSDSSVLTDFQVKLMGSFLLLPPTFKHLFHFQRVIGTIDKYLEPHHMIYLKRSCKLIKNKVGEAANFMNIFQYIQINDDYCQFLPRQQLITWYIQQFNLYGNLHPKELSIKSIADATNDETLLERLIMLLAPNCSSLLKLSIENTPFEKVKIIFQVNKGKMSLKEFTNIDGEIGDGVQYLEEIYTLKQVYISIEDISKFESLVTKYVEINLSEDKPAQKAFFVNQNIRRQALDMGILVVYDSLNMNQYKQILKDVKQLNTIRIYNADKLSDYFFDFLSQNKYYKGLTEFVFRNSPFLYNSIIKRFFDFFNTNLLVSSLIIDFTGCEPMKIHNIANELIKNKGIESLFYRGQDLLRQFRIQESQEQRFKSDSKYYDRRYERDVYEYEKEAYEFEQLNDKEAYQYLDPEADEELLQEQLLQMIELEKEDERSSLMD